MPADPDANLGDLPRVCVAVVVERDGRILLLKRGPSRTFPGTWALPGGRLDTGETLDECCRRELLEETGLAAGRFTFECVTEVFGPPHLIGLVFHAHEVTGTAANVEPDKHDEIGWFGRDAMPTPLMPGVIQWLEGRESLDAELADRVIAMVRRLPERDFVVLNLHYGIDGPAHNLVAVGKALPIRISRERVRQKIEVAIRRLVFAVADERCARDHLEDLIIAGRMREREREEKQPHG